MQKRAVGIAVLALLLASGLTAAYAFWRVERHATNLDIDQDELAGRLVRMGDTIAAIGAAQQSYVAPGQLDEQWFERTSSLVQQLKDDTAALRPRLRAPQSESVRQALVEATDALVDADTRTRQNLRLGQDLMAADVIFSDVRNTLDVMGARLHELRAAELAWQHTERAALSRWRWLLLGMTMLVWTLGLAGFAASRAPAAASSEVKSEAPRPQPERPAPPDTAGVSVDLAAAAQLCTDLSRVSTTEALPGLLGRTAALLDASGIVLWLSAGEQLFAATGHGYEPPVLARLGPIARGENNAVASAWRAGRLTTVAAHGTTVGAIVAPMFGPLTCVGVLAIEIRHGREQDPATQALAVMIAAQLATAVSAWPAGSSAEPVPEVLNVFSGLEVRSA